MKRRPFGVVLLAICVFIRPATFAQKQDFSETISKYDISREATFKGVVGELGDRICPIGGDMRFHLTLKIGNETYEVHVAPVNFMKIYKAAFHKGDSVEIIGVKTQFKGADAIVPREIKHGEYTLLFRDENGKPIW
jgi:DNA/RNA endonuclease YhcR with UshA esterase domain